MDNQSGMLCINLMWFFFLKKTNKQQKQLCSLFIIAKNLTRSYRVPSFCLFFDLSNIDRWKHLAYQLSYFLRDGPCNSTVKEEAHQSMLKYVPFFAFHFSFVVLFFLFFLFSLLRRIIWSTHAVTFPHALTVSQRKGLCAQRQKCFTLKPTLVSYLKNKITTATLWSEAY